jgi:two-component system, response regulator, stage 0 sporulation protein F
MMMKKVLYIDDELINLQLFEINFGRKYQVFVAIDGSAGLEILNNNPDTSIIISDMKMPEMNGIEFIKIAKAKYPDKKYYVLTGYQITDEIRNAIETGLILKYFSKPFNIKEISNEMDKS